MSIQSTRKMSAWGAMPSSGALIRDKGGYDRSDEEEECQICRSDELPASISLLPCNHKVCISCVEAMRAKNIFKGEYIQFRYRVFMHSHLLPSQVDRGVRCPFCRGFVDEYAAINAETSSQCVKEIIETANR